MLFESAAAAVDCALELAAAGGLTDCGRAACLAQAEMHSLAELAPLTVVGLAPQADSGGGEPATAAIAAPAAGEPAVPP